MTLIDACLLQAAGAGDRNSQERLLKMHSALLWAMARKTLSVAYLWEPADAMQTARLTLLHCARHLDLDRLPAFGVYVGTAILRACLRERRLYRRGWVTPENASEPEPVLGGEALDGATVSGNWRDGAEQDAALTEALAQLDPDARALLTRRYGLHDGEAHSLAAVGNELGCSPQWVWQLERRALRELRWALGAEA